MLDIEVFCVFFKFIENLRGWFTREYQWSKNDTIGHTTLYKTVYSSAEEIWKHSKSNQIVICFYLLKIKNCAFRTIPWEEGNVLLFKVMYILICAVAMKQKDSLQRICWFINFAWEVTQDCTIRHDAFFDTTLQITTTMAVLWKNNLSISLLLIQGPTIWPP